MRALTIRYSVFLGALVLCSVLIERNLVQAENRVSGRYSINFNDTPISEALRQLTQTTRIKINVGRSLEGRITKSYRNQSIDEIIRDMLKNLSYASIWTYSEKGVDSIDIRVFDEDKSGASRGMAIPEPVTPIIEKPRAKRPVVTSRTRSETDTAGSTDTEKDAEQEDQKDEEEKEQASTGAGQEENENLKGAQKDSEKEETEESSGEKEDAESEKEASPSTETNEDKESGSPETSAEKKEETQ